MTDKKQSTPEQKFIIPYDSIDRQNCPVSCMKNCALRQKLQELAKTQRFEILSYGHNILVPNFFFDSSDPYDVSVQQTLGGLMHPCCDNCRKSNPHDDQRETVIYHYSPRGDGISLKKPCEPDVFHKLRKGATVVFWNDNVLPVHRTQYELICKAKKREK